MYYKKEIDEVLREYNSSEDGLTSKEAELRLKKYGKNEIQKFKKISSLRIFLSQFKSFLIYILLASTLLAFILGEKIDAVVILVILLLNAILGFFQEYKAEKSIEALRRLTALTAIVIRNKKTMKIDSSEIVPGDIIIIES